MDIRATWLLPRMYARCLAATSDPTNTGTFSIRNAPEAQAKLRVSARYLYKIRYRIELLAGLYEVLV